MGDVPRASMIKLGSPFLSLHASLVKEIVPGGSQGFSCSLWEAHTAILVCPAKARTLEGYRQLGQVRVRKGLAEGGAASPWGGQPEIGVGDGKNETATAPSTQAKGFVL